MSLETLVPPLDMCKKLKPEDFPESVMVWHLNNAGGYSVFLRIGVQGIKGTEKIPAPTLEEIMTALSGCIDVAFCNATIWITGQAEILVQQGGVELDEIDTNPATAALRLWLKLKGVRE